MEGQKKKEGEEGRKEEEGKKGGKGTGREAAESAPFGHELLGRKIYKVKHQLKS